MTAICKLCQHYDEMLTLPGMPGVPCWMGQDPKFVENDDCQYFEQSNNSAHADAGDSVVSTSSLQASADTTSQALSTPTKRG